MKKLILTFILALSFVVLQAHVDLVYPLGGESFDPGEVVTIQWKIIIPHTTENWDLYFSNDGGATWNPIRLDIGPDTLFYDWTIPDDPTQQGRVRVVMDNSGQDYEDQSDDFTVTGSSGIGDLSGPNDFTLCPNPAGNFIYLESDFAVRDGEVQISDLLGKTLAVYPISKESFENNRLTLPLDGLKPGIYFLSVRSTDKAVTRKFIKY